MMMARVLAHLLRWPNTYMILGLTSPAVAISGLTRGLFIRYIRRIRHISLNLWNSGRFVK